MSNGNSARKARRAKEQAQKRLAEKVVDEARMAKVEGKKSFFRDPANANWLIVILTFALVLVAIYQFRAMRGQLAVMEGQMTDSRTQFSLSHRPWVNMSVKNERLVFDRTGGYIPVSFILKNGGTAPALGVNEFQTPLHVKPIPQTPDEARQALNCNSAVGGISDESGELILPGDSGVSQDLTMKSAPEQVIDPTIRTNVWIPVCIHYKDDGGNSPEHYHATGFLLIFVPSSGNRDFLPTGTIEGKFEVSGFGYVSY